jgi:hypothetical protein
MSSRASVISMSQTVLGIGWGLFPLTVVDERELIPIDKTACNGPPV